MKRSFSLILCLVLALSLLASCASTEEQEHKHTYGATWSSNEAGHWYAATCEHTDLKANMSTHQDPANDGVCDVCGYGSDHVHTYDTVNWTSDDNNHWNAVTCGHNVDPQNKAAHTDTNNDGNCDTCGYASHEHTFSDLWSNDATNHWHASTCESECSAVTLVTPHSGMDDGFCDVCDWSIFDSIIENATSEEAANAVNGGTIEISESYTDYWSKEWLTDTSSATFEFGTDYFHTLGSNDTEDWYSAYTTTEGKAIFAVHDYDTTDAESGLMLAYGATLSNLNGYAFNLNTYECYGVSDIIATLYEAACEQAYVDITLKKGEGDVTTYSFNFVAGDTYAMYLYSVTFTPATDANGQTYIADAEISATEYNKADLAEITDRATQQTYYVVSTGAEALSSVTYTVTQTAGERTATNPYPADTNLVNGFKLQDADGNPVNNGDTINMTLGEGSTYLFFTNVDPATANWALNDVSYVTTNAAGEEVYDVNVYLQSDWETGEYYLEISPYDAKAGIYTVNITTAKVSYTIVVNLVSPTLESLNTQVTFGDGWLDTNTATVLEGVTFKYQLIANPEAANAEVTYAVTEGDAASVTFGQTTPDWFGNVYPTLSFAKAGTYVITFTSVENTEITCTLTVTVEKAPTPAELLQGKWFYKDAWGGGTVIIEFTPESEGAVSGTAVINYNGETTVNYAYDETNGVVFTNTDGSAYTAVSVEIAEDYTLSVSFGVISGETLAEYTPEGIVAGTYIDSDPNDWFATPNYEIVLNNDGTGTFSTMETYFSSYEMFTWDAEAQDNGSYKLTLTASGGMLNYDYTEFDAATANATYTADGKLVLTLTVDGTATEVTLNAR